MFQLSQLRCFVEVAAELHFGRAAERLNMTQPPLSRQIQQLEHALGVQLLVRTRRAVDLTAAGEAFLPQAREILQRCAVAAQVAQRAMRGETGRVVLGYSAGANYSFLPRVVAAAQQHLSDIELELREMVTVDQLDALRAGRIDLALIRLPAEPAGLEMTCVVREPLVLAVPRKHALARKRKPALQDLHDQPFVMYLPGDGRYFHEVLQTLFHEAGVAPRFVQFVRHTHSMMALVNSGIGLALVPRSSTLLRLEGVVARPMDLPDYASAQMHLAWRGREAVPRPALTRFRELMIAQASLD